MRELIKKLFDNKFVFWGCFGIIILLGLGLRLTLIDLPIWYDEGCSIATAVKEFPFGIDDYLWNHDLQHTPLYFYILHFIMQFFGDGVVVMRISSVLISMLTLPLTYIVTEKLSDKKIGLAAMLLMSVNTFQVLYSVEIRMYPYVILLSLLSINYLIDYDRNSDKKSLIKLGIVNVLNPYFLTGSIVFVIAQFIVYSCYLDYKHADEKKISDYMRANLITGLFFIPYIVIIVHYALIRSQFLVTDLTSFTQMNFWGTIQNVIACDPGHIHETRFEKFPMNIQSTLLIFLPIAGMFCGLLGVLKDKERLNHAILGIITLCFVAFMALAYTKTTAFTGRYIIFVTPFIFILMTIGLSKFNKYFLVGLILLYSVGCVYGLKSTYKYYRDIAEFSLKSPADFCKKNYPGKDNLVIMPFASSVSFYYFQGDEMPRVMPLELLHEIRNADSKIVYDDIQSQALKTKDKYKVFQKIITKDDFISKNLTEFLDGYIKSVPKGGYIIWVVYYTDNYAIQRPEIIKQTYSNMNNVMNYTSIAMLSKFDLDLLAILEQRARFVTKDRDASNQFFVFQRK